MYRYLLNQSKKFIPKISETERIALMSGTKSIEGYFFEGRHVKKLAYSFPKINRSLPMIQKTNELCQQIQDDMIFKTKTIPSEIIEKVKSDGFLGLIIPKEFGGQECNHHEQSQIVQKISTASNPVGVFVMVPNSLGPAELILKYGTQEQKDKYLQGLASGKYVPCFGLTGPHSGSDAGSMKDIGIVFQNEKGERKIRLSLNKRYITLAPIANLIGVAFQLKDPDQLLKHGKEGITLALLSRDILEIGNRHNPMDVPFPNGTIQADNIDIDIDSIIGGESNSGNGWKMLMECLAVGRAISLPACAVGSAKLATLYAGTYSVYRKQFKVMIKDMEGVKEKLASMVSETLKINAIQSLTNAILDHGEKPSVLSAIMKYETTERSRTVINHGMDIVAGAGICKGPKNIIANHYQSIPIGITVEGSNTLTKSLIIFGNGLIKSHPQLYPLIESIEKNQEGAFKTFLHQLLLTNIVNIGSCFGYQIGSVFYPKDLEFWMKRYTILFSLYANIILLLGKRFKTNEYTSGRMAEILGSLYICTALEWYSFHQPTLREICILAQKEELIKIHDRFTVLSKNIPNIYLRFLCQILKKERFDLTMTDQNRNSFCSELVENETLRYILSENISIPPPLQEMLFHYHTILKYHSDPHFQRNQEYEKIIDRAIQVDSF